LYEEAVRRGIDVGDFVIMALTKALDLDPGTAVRARLELAVKYLDEGRGLVDKDPVQASEKLYKAAEECVKALAQHYDLRDVLDKVNERGRWTVTELEKAVLAISRRLGDWFGEAWDRAWVLHVWGFHEAKLDAEDVRIRLPSIEKIVKETQVAVGIRA
ncbi:PaREP1 family protein, partial [Caldivirga sp. UBA161]|uniref:PaREP1 family protein n=1 Tax=Caldivirga sp. UBA161 TaxID=1915569 RepID=UPI0025BB96B4